MMAFEIVNITPNCRNLCNCDAFVSHKEDPLVAQQILQGSKSTLACQYFTVDTGPYMILITSCSNLVYPFSLRRWQHFASQMLPLVFEISSEHAEASKEDSISAATLTRIH